MYVGISLIQVPWLVRGTIKMLGNLFVSGTPALTDPGHLSRLRASITLMLDLSTADVMAVTADVRDIGRLIVACAHLVLVSTDIKKM